MQDNEDLSGGLFEDEDTRVFYEELPNLVELVPGAALPVPQPSSPRPIDAPNPDISSAAESLESAAEAGGVTGEADFGVSQGDDNATEDADGEGGRESAGPAGVGSCGNLSFIFELTSHRARSQTCIAQVPTQTQSYQPGTHLIRW